MAIEFKLNTNVIYGPQSLDRLLPFLQERNYRNVSVIIDSAVERSEYWRSFSSQLSQTCAARPYFKNEEMEPSYDYLDQIRGQFSPDVDCLIGVGGGSTMDLAKVISVLVSNGEKAISYRGFGLIENPGVPLILVPTTAGTGSEVTPFAVFTDTTEQRKFGINSPLYLPILTIIDPLLTLGCPASVTMGCGMDALTHALESFVARKHSVASRLFSREAFALVFNNLPRVVNDPSNVELRSRLSLGAYYAGIGLFNSAAGPAGGLSYPIGTFFKVPHGMAGAAFLYPVVRFNIEHGYRGYEPLVDLIEGQAGALSIEPDKSERFLKAFGDLCDGLGIPKSLKVFGVSSADIPRILDQMRLLWSAVEQNPVPVSETDLENMLRQMLN